MASFKQKKCSVILESLPSDLFLEVFSRLPCKDIVVCKCICKAWYNFLSHPNFSRHYAKYPHFTPILLLRHLSVDNTAYAFLLEIAADGRFIKTPLPTSIPNFHLNSGRFSSDIRHTYIIESCNGLLFFCKIRGFESIVDYQWVYCYNPLSGGCVLLAGRKWPRPTRWPRGQWSVQYRVGTDISSTGNVKLLAFVNREQPARILTVGIDRRWRRLEDRLDHHEKWHGVSFNGVYHWIRTNTNPANSTHLKTFDFGKEKIGPEWELPGDLDTGTIKLAVINGRISVIEKSCTFYMVIWTMGEYGVAGSWSKKKIMGDYWPPKIHATLTNGGLLFSSDDGSEFTLVNLEKEETKIEVCKSKTGSSMLYAAEFAPKL